MADDYGGLFGGIAFAFRRSDSYLLRAYVAASVLVGGFVAIFLLLALVSWLGAPAALGQRALLGVIGIFVFLPLFSPVLVVARRRRRGAGSRLGDAILGLAGFGFLLAVYLALFISDPNPTISPGLLAPAFHALDALPRRYWVAPPLLSVASIVLAIRGTRSLGTSGHEGDATEGSEAPSESMDATDDGSDGAEG